MKALRMISLAVPIAVAALLIIVVNPAYPFLPEATGTGANSFTADAWPQGQPVNWVINPTRSSVIVGSTSVTSVMQASFATWTTAPNTNLSVNLSGNSSITDANQVPNGTNLVCFVCTGVNFSSSDGTLALTSTFSNGSGVITQADIYFNPSPQNVQFVTDPQTTPCPTSSPSPQDLQTVATHEIGHFLGLDHSGIARAIMYPFAPCILTTLSYDDLAGISTSYPSSAPIVSTGKITGSVTTASNGTAVFGAHVSANSTTAANPFSAFTNIRKTPIGTLTLPNGTFTISGVPADSYVVMAEPLDGPVDNTAVEWGLPAQPPTFNQQIQTNFTTRWH